MNDIEYLHGDEQDEEKTDRELSEEELEAVAGGRGMAEGVIAADVDADLEAAVNADQEKDIEKALDKDISKDQQRTLR